MGTPVGTERLEASAAGLARAGELLRGGGLVAMPTETVYGLAAVARDAAAVERIFIAKGRPHWDPLIVHVADAGMVGTVARAVADVEQRLMEAFWPGPLTLLLPRRPELPPVVTAGRELVGVRMPRHPVAVGMIRAAGAALAAPSANRFGHVSPTCADHVLADLDGRIDAIVDAGACGIGVESTVAECSASEIVLYRAGGVSAADLERVAGLPVRVYAQTAGARPESLPSPGVGIRHYATRARVVLLEGGAELAAWVSEPAHRDAGVLLPLGWRLPAHAGAVHAWARFDDAAGLAAALYSGLRALDAAGVAEIAVPLPRGKDGLFAALRDRLEKAARSV